MKKLVAVAVAVAVAAGVAALLQRRRGARPAADVWRDATRPTTS